MELLQALDGICRDEISVINDQAEKFESERTTLVTEDQANQVFDKLFTSTRNV